MLTDTEMKREQAFKLYVAQQFQSSIETCLTSLVGAPWQAWCYYLLGLNYLALGRRAEAGAALSRYVELDGSIFSSTRRKAMSILEELARGR